MNSGELVSDEIVGNLIENFVSNKNIKIRLYLMISQNFNSG